MPYDGQSNGWSDPAQERYHFILKRADSVVSLSREYYSGCMLDRNRRLVESVGIFLAVYNGSRRSGTGAMVQYAQELGREMIWIDPVSRCVSHGGTK